MAGLRLLTLRRVYHYCSSGLPSQRLLAEGVKRASEILAGKSKKYAMHIKGLEMCVTEPRTQTNLALGYATTPIGARFNICEHDWDYDTQLGWPHTMQSLNTPVILERIPMDYRGPKKCAIIKRNQIVGQLPTLYVFVSLLLPQQDL